MRIELRAATDAPMEVISQAAGTCYGKTDFPDKRVVSCYKAGHMSVFEHASVTFHVEGISRTCSHQLVRHRIASFSQRSGRYCRTDSDDWYVTPDAFSGRLKGFYDDSMRRAMRDYQDAMKAGVKPEDARFLLPEACKTEITVTMNCRELFHFLDLRQSPRSQWEIRELANALDEALRGLPGWRQLMELRDE